MADDELDIPPDLPAEAEKPKRGDVVDIDSVIKRGAQSTTLSDLASKGFNKVRVLNESMVRDLIAQAVEKVVSSQTTEQRAKMISHSRKELDKLMREARDFKSRAELLETGKNDLVKQVENLQRQLKEQRTLVEQSETQFQNQLQEMLDRQTGIYADNQYLQGEKASLQLEKDRLERQLKEARDSVEWLKSRHEGELQEARNEVSKLTEESDALRREIEAEREKAKAAGRVAELEKALEEARAASEAAKQAHKQDIENAVAALKRDLERAREKTREVESGAAMDRARHAHEYRKLRTETDKLEKILAGKGGKPEEWVGEMEKERQAARGEIESLKAELARMREQAGSAWEGDEGDESAV